MDEELYKRPLVEKALRRSYAKRRIVEYLSIHGFGYISQIATNTLVTPTNVLGAMKGMKNRYNAGDSLVALGIVEEMKDTAGSNTTLYHLTASWGQEAIRMCKNFNKNI